MPCGYEISAQQQRARAEAITALAREIAEGQREVVAGRISDYSSSPAADAGATLGKPFCEACAVDAVRTQLAAQGTSLDAVQSASRNLARARRSSAAAQRRRKRSR